MRNTFSEPPATTSMMAADVGVGGDDSDGAHALPLELWTNVLSFVDPLTLSNLMLTCKRLCALSRTRVR